MKKILLLAVLCLPALGLSAQNIVSHSLSEFNQLSITGKMNVILIPSDQNNFELTLHDTDADRFSWNISNGKLVLKLKANTRREGSADVKIYYTKLDQLEVSTASVRSEGAVVSDVLSLKISNGGNITLEMQSKDVALHADGNSAATLSGETLYLSIGANSKTKIDARALQSRSAMVNAQFNSEVFVWGTERLEAKSTSNSIVYYKGTPEIFKPSTATMGGVEQFSY